MTKPKNLAIEIVKLAIKAVTIVLVPPVAAISLSPASSSNKEFLTKSVFGYRPCYDDDLRHSKRPSWHRRY